MTRQKQLDNCSQTPGWAQRGLFFSETLIRAAGLDLSQARSNRRLQAGLGTTFSAGLPVTT